MNKPLAVSIGDPAGIGPDIILKSWHSRAATRLPQFFVLGDVEVLKSRADLLRLDVNFLTAGAEQTLPDANNALSVLQLENRMTDDAGKPSPTNAAGTIEAISRCTEQVVNGVAAGMVTCPINKKVLYDAGFQHPGHTEFLAELARPHSANDIHPVMMLAGPALKVVPVTVHVPLSEVPVILSCELIVKTGTITANELSSRFGIDNPRLAIAGLNPHAGENGSMGREEDETIRPAVEQLTALGILATGPLSADTMFHPDARETYDAALCMYHDQALIPAKTLGFHDSVNVTLGLPFIRTSPDHGTAYDIAGTGAANPASFVAALKMAAMMGKRKTG